EARPRRARPTPRPINREEPGGPVMHIRSIVIALPLIIAVPAIAHDKPSPMQSAFGNTIVTTATDKSVTRTYVDADGKYRSVTPTYESTGTWTVRKGMVCYAQVTPVFAAPLCAIGANKKVGDKWSLVQPDGMSIKVTIVAGR